jgi:hypothetical protein
MRKDNKPIKNILYCLMPRPKIAKEKQRKIIAVSLSPEALERIAAFQAQHIKEHGYRISRSQAVGMLILRPRC